MPLPKSYPVVLPAGKYPGLILTATEGVTSTHKRYVRLILKVTDQNLDLENMEQMFWLDNLSAMQKLTHLYDSLVPSEDPNMYISRLEGSRVMIGLYLNEKDGFKKNGIASIKPLLVKQEKA